jgi:hypothetical protein
VNLFAAGMKGWWRAGLAGKIGAHAGVQVN